jgi:Ca2+-binding RTX toxin-like protein
MELRRLFATLPVSSGLVLHLDGSNVLGTGVNPANNALVTTWKDLSGKNNNAVAAGPAPKFVLSGVNNKPAIDFSNPNDLGYVVPVSADFSSPNSTAFIVMNPVTGTFFSAAMGISEPNSYNNEMLLGFGWGGTYPKAPTIFHHTSAGNFRYRSSAALSGTTPFIQAGVFGQAVDDTTQVINGTTSVTPLVTSGGPAPYTTVNRAVYIGRRGFLSSTEYLNGKIAEIIVFNRKLSAAEQNQIGGYLESKYGIAAAYTPTSEVDVLGKGVSIVDGDATAGATDDTLFGTTAAGVPVSRTFTVRNYGSLALTTSGLTVPAGYTVTEPLSASIAPGAQDTFTVRLDAASAGTYAGQVSFTNNDGNESPYNFAISGTVTTPTFSLVSGVLTVTGTSGSDSIRGSITSNVLTMRVNGLSQTFANASSISRIVVNALAGNDSIILGPSVNRPTSLNGGDGDDTIVGGSGADVINGGAGTDLAVKGTGDTTSLVEEILG